MNFDYQNWILLPLLIFVARMSDVTLATLRNIFIAKGFKRIVPIIGFFEVLIWLLAARQVFGSLTNPACFIAWAAGFAMGTYIGMRIDEYLALGLQVIRVITPENHEALVGELRSQNHGVTIVDAQGATGPVKFVYTVVRRKNLKEVIGMIEKHCPNVFYSVEDVRKSSRGIFVNDSGIFNVSVNR
jgi:uncharacterized protein YebE (UPF0316 family)